MPDQGALQQFLDNAEVEVEDALHTAADDLTDRLIRLGPDLTITRRLILADRP